PEAALTAYAEALSVRPGNADALLAVAEIRARQGNALEAEAGFRRVLEQSPDRVDAIAGLGFLRLNEKKFEEAQRLLAQARSAAPQRADIDKGHRTAKFWGVMQRASADLAQNRPEAAIRGFQEALSLNVATKDALLGLADATARTKNFAEAAKVYERL